MSSESVRIAWIGTGLMGLPMAQRALAAGHHLTVFARHPEQVASLESAGASIAGSVADAVRDAQVVVTIVSAPADVEQIYVGVAGVLANVAPGTVAVDMTTSDPALALTLAQLASRRGVTLLDAPVSGGPTGAEAGTLSVMVGGAADGLEIVRPVLESFASTVVHQGTAGSGQLTKLVNQTLVAGVTLATCEAFALASRGGLNLDRARDSIGTGVGGSALFNFLWSRLCDGNLEPGFKLDHLRKDLRLVSDVVGDASLPGTALVAELVELVRSQQGGDRGTQALVTAMMDMRG